ncbi:hypothetical protein AVEN_7565-1 [Araneus ventricosus]|uniref:Uncharacterized protein n=1 Tax=Araneus ventricosus TaxID=182803 RepID=A0A4Y2KR48_ARAVE|nr:hypothetical protein AVEN_7565-1 [Araneus ventricosus]
MALAPLNLKQTNKQTIVVRWDSLTRGAFQRLQKYRRIQRQIAQGNRRMSCFFRFGHIKKTVRGGHSLTAERPRTRPVPWSLSQPKLRLRPSKVYRELIRVLCQHGTPRRGMSAHGPRVVSYPGGFLAEVYPDQPAVPYVGSSKS